MNIIGVQSSPSWNNPEESRGLVRSQLSSIEISSGDLLILPEMFTTGFSVETLGGAEDEQDSESCRFLQELADRSNICTLGGVPILAAGGGENRAVIARPNQPVGSYSKSRLFTPGGEGRSFTAGDGLTTFKWGEWTVGVTICYDLRFPEIYRALVAGGAELLVCIASWPALRSEHWRALLIARAIENQAFVVGINRAGSDPNFEYAGGSIIISPLGEVLAEAGSDEEVLATSIDRSKLLQWRNDFPVLQDQLSVCPPIQHFG